jgi:hypothetical protein
MSQQGEVLRRREIRRAVGTTAETMLRDVAEGMQQLGTALNYEKSRTNALIAALQRAEAQQEAFRGRSLWARWRWLLIGR